MGRQPGGIPLGTTVCRSFAVLCTLIATHSVGKANRISIYTYKLFSQNLNPVQVIPNSVLSVCHFHQGPTEVKSE